MLLLSLKWKLLQVDSDWREEVIVHIPCWLKNYISKVIDWNKCSFYGSLNQHGLVYASHNHLAKKVPTLTISIFWTISIFTLNIIARFIPQILFKYVGGVSFEDKVKNAVCSRVKSEDMTSSTKPNNDNINWISVKCFIVLRYDQNC